MNSFNTISINVDQAVANVLSERAYIMFRAADYRELTQRTKINDSMQRIFNDKMSQIKKKSYDQQVETIRKSMAEKGKLSAAALSAIDDLESGNQLASILDGIADALNTSISRTYNTKSYNEILVQAGNFTSIMENGKASARQLNDFFDLITQAIAQINNGKVPRDLLIGLGDIGKVLGPNSFKLTGNKSRAISNDQLKEVDMILTTLGKASEKLQQSGSISSKSFASTITHIFSTIIGEKLSMFILKNALEHIEPELMKALQKLGVTVNGTSNFSLGRSSNNKSDIFNSDAFDLNVSINGMDCTIEIGSNTSVKWYQDIAKGDSTNIHLVSGTTFGNLLQSFDREVGNVMRNIVAHSKEKPELYSGLRTVLSASFVDSWLAGKGLKTKSGNIDTVQFIMVNGKLYSVYSIIAKIVDQSLKYGVIGGNPNTTFGGIIAAQDLKYWEEKTSGDPDMWAPAFRRSDPLKRAIDNLTIGCTLNSNFLNI